MGSSSSSLSDIADAAREETHRKVRTAFAAHNVFSTSEGVKKITDLCQELAKKGQTSFEFVIAEHTGAFSVGCLTFDEATKRYGLDVNFPSVYGPYGLVVKSIEADVDWEIWENRWILKVEFERWMRGECEKTEKQVKEELRKRGLKTPSFSAYLRFDCSVRVRFDW